MADFAFVLKEKYKLHKTSKNMIGYKKDFGFSTYL